MDSDRDREKFDSLPGEWEKEGEKEEQKTREKAI